MIAVIVACIIIVVVMLIVTLSNPRGDVNTIVKANQTNIT